MPGFTVKDIPEDLYDRLKQSARLHHRSVNREILALLETGLRSERVPATEILASGRQIQKAMGDRILKLEEIESARREGRA
ncbi:MAG: Arc family DNA-binding protein [Gemmatimonadetes bacterium]|nr:Arc family DNA-binding protein [Gemmatimonadota bacterium]